MKNRKKYIAAVLTIPVILAVLLLSGITIPLDFLDHRLENLASNLLDREITIHGPVRLKTSLQPSLEFGGLSIGNPRDWPPEDTHLLTVEHGQGQVSLTDLFRGEIRILNLEFSGVDLQLVTRPDHSTNYQFASSKPKPDKQLSSSDHELTGLDRISLRDIRLSYIDELSGKKYSLSIDEALGQGMPKSPLHFSLKGKLAGQSCTLEISGGTLHDLLLGKENWLLTEGSLTLGDISLNVTGALNRAKQDMAGYLALSLDGHSLDGIGTIFELPLVEIGDFSLDTRIGLLPGMFHFTGLQVAAFNSSLEGDLVLSLHGKRPTLAGNIAIPTLDPALFSAFRGRKPEDNSPDVPRSTHSLPWDTLQFIDTDLNLRIGNFAWNPLQVRDLQATVSLIDGDLIVPFSFMTMDTPAKGRMDILTSGGIPMIELGLTSESTKLAPLLAVLTGQQQFNGQLGALLLNGKTQGHSVHELAKALDLNIQIGATKLLTESGPILTTKALSLKRQPGQAFSLFGKGDLLGRPFNLQVRTGRSGSSSNTTAVPLSLQLAACDTELVIDGSMQADKRETLAARFSVSGQKLCGLLGPVENFMGKSTDFSASGEVKLRRDGWLLDLETGRLGNTTMDGKVEQKIGHQGKPLINAKVHSSALDLSPFLHRPETASHNTASNPPQSAPKESVKKTNGGNTASISPQQVAMIKKLLTMEILPKKRLLATDAILELDIEKLETGRGRVSNIRLSGEVADGKLIRAPFQAIVAGKQFTGNAGMTFTNEVPAIHFELAAQDFNLPDLFQEFQIGHAPNLTANHIALDLNFKGKTIKELLRQSSQQMTIKGGRWIVARELTEPLHIDIERATYSSTPDTPSRIALKGFINSEPLTIELTEDGLFRRGSNKPLVLAIRAGLADTELQIDSQLIRKAHADNILQLDTLLTGSRMNRLNEVFGINLPPLGPYLMGGSLQIEGDTFTFHDLELQIGESTLNGEMVFSGTRNESGTYDFPLNLQTKLNAETIQLNDFRLGDWSPVSKEPQTNSAAVQEEKAAVQEEGKRSSNQLNDLLSPELAARLEGSLNVEVREVLSGKDKLGSGHLSAKLEDGLYALDSLRLDIPGGAVHIQGSLRPETAKLEVRLGMQIKHLDYGILARRAKPDSELKGELNLNLDLHAVADSPLQLKEHLNGHLRFGLVPEELQAGVVDLWAVNIITAALPALLKGSKSEVNCLAGDFTLEDGIMRPEVFLLDTSKMRVEGKGEVNFKTNAIDFHLRPTPKSAHFFSLATPISVSGTITDFNIGVTAGSIFKTVFRMASSLVTVPFQWLFSDNMEPDGRQACSAAMDWVSEAGTE